MNNALDSISLKHNDNALRKLTWRQDLNFLSVVYPTGDISFNCKYLINISGWFSPWKDWN